MVTKRAPAAKHAKKPPKQKASRLAAPRKAPKARQPTVDLVSLELAYRTTGATLEILGRAHGISKGRVSQLATEHGWTRDLQATVRARADAKVQAHAAHEAKVEAGTEAAIEHGAEFMASTILRERKDVVRMLAITAALFDELEAHNAKAKLKPGEPGADVAAKADPLAIRIDNTRKLVETTKTLLLLERTVLNITPDTPIDPGKRVAEAVDNGFAGLQQAFAKKLGRA